MMRVVLDSNVWLDWLFFDDPRVAPLKAAWDNRQLDIVIDVPCRDELVRVLGYERFELDPPAQATMLSEVDRLTTLLLDLSYVPTYQLPHCSDPDDVKFLALAEASQADWLITKDNALLGRRRKRLRESTRYRIGTPAQWSGAAT